MADHFYAKTKATADVRDDTKITVGTGSAGATTVEVRIPDAVSGLTRREVAAILEHIKEYILTKDTLAILTN